MRDRKPIWNSDRINAGSAIEENHGPTPLRNRRKAARRHPTELHAEQDHAEDGDPECRDRHPEQRRRHHKRVNPGPAKIGSDRPEQHADGDREGNRQRGKRERDRQAFHHGREHTLVENQRGAEIALRQIEQPDCELFEERTIEAELPAHLFDRCGRRLLAGDDDGGIAGQQAEQQKCQDRDDHDDRHGLQKFQGHDAYQSSLLRAAIGTASTSRKRCINQATGPTAAARRHNRSGPAVFWNSR